MGRRSRTAARLDEAPPAPWAPFPLVELCILVGLVLLGVGALGDGPRARASVVGGVALVALATLELSLREHLAGYRSHTLLLAGALAVAVAAALSVLTALPRLAVLVLGVATFAGAFGVLRRAFRTRSGGPAFRV